jgi:hypothetical protein
MRGGRWLKTRIETHLAYWRPRLVPPSWTVDVRWRPDASTAGHTWGEFNALAVRYGRRMSAALYFNLRTIARDNANDRRVEEVVVHELIHVLIPASEGITNILANALVSARRDR